MVIRDNLFQELFSWDLEYVYHSKWNVVREGYIVIDTNNSDVSGLNSFKLRYPSKTIRLLPLSGYVYNCSKLFDSCNIHNN